MAYGYDSWLPSDEEEQQAQQPVQQQLPPPRGALGYGNATAQDAAGPIGYNEVSPSWMDTAKAAYNGFADDTWLGRAGSSIGAKMTGSAPRTEPIFKEDYSSASAPQAKGGVTLGDVFTYGTPVGLATVAAQKLGFEKPDAQQPVSMDPNSYTGAGNGANTLLAREYAANGWKDADVKANAEQAAAESDTYGKTASPFDSAQSLQGDTPAPLTLRESGTDQLAQALDKSTIDEQSQAITRRDDAIKALMVKPAEEVFAQAAPSAPQTPFEKDEARRAAMTPREKLLASAGVNVAANDATDAKKAAATDAVKTMKEQWDAARADTQSGDILKRGDGLLKLASLEREGMQKGLITQDTGAAQELRKFQNDPYEIRDYNRAQEQKTASDAKAAQQADTSSKRTQQDFENALKLSADQRAGAAQKLAENTQAQSVTEKTQARQDALDKETRDATREVEKEGREQGWDKEKMGLELANEKSKIQSRLDAVDEMQKRQDAPQYAAMAANNAIQAGAYAVKKSVERLQESVGGVGALRDYINGENGNAEVDKIIDTAKRAYQDEYDKTAAMATARGIAAPSMKPFDEDRVRAAIGEAGPKRFDNLTNTVGSLFNVAKNIVQVATPAGRLGTALAPLLGSGQSQGGAPGFGLSGVPAPTPFNGSYAQQVLMQP